MEKCIVCGKEAKYKLCFTCYTEKNHIKEELIGINEFDEVKDYYNNLKYNIFRIKKMDYARTGCLKLIALGEKLENEFKVKGNIDKAHTDVVNLLEKKQAYILALNSATEEKKEAKPEVEEQSEIDIPREEKIDKEEVLDYRRVYPMTFRCKDGHYVRSKSEKMIDDALTARKIIHYYEQRIVNEESNETYFPDFFLPHIGGNNGTYIEYFGLSTPEYMKTEEKKKSFYKKNNISVIFIQDKHIANLDDFLEDEIRKIEKKSK